MGRHVVILTLFVTLSYTCHGYVAVHRRAGPGFGNTDSSNGMPSNGNSIGLPFSSASGSGSSGNGGMGTGPFSGSAGSLAGSSSGGGQGHGAGMGGSPFASGAGSGAGMSGSTGMGAGPFTGGHGTGSSNSASSGSDAGGQSPFAAALASGSGMNPFTSNMDGGSSSLMSSSGPGGLSGGDFSVNNSAVLMGHNFANEMSGTGTGEGNGDGPSRFDTSAYQQMLNQMFTQGNTDSNLNTLGNPFDGTGFSRPQGGTGSKEHYNTAAEVGMGGYASTDMVGSGYGDFSGAASGQNPFQGSSNQNTGNGKFNTGSGNYNTGSGGSMGNTDTGSATNTGTYSQTSTNANLEMGNPFNVNNYDTNVAQNQMSANSNGQTPFDTHKFGMGGNPFQITNHNNNFGSSNVGNTMAQNPFDGYQSSGGASNMFSTDTSEYSYREDKGLDEYGNVNFAQLSGISGNNVDLGNGGYHNTAYGTNTGNSASYSTYGGSSNNGGVSYTSYNAGTDSNYGYTTDSRYETPFETDNYNDLLSSPYQSGSAGSSSGGNRGYSNSGGNARYSSSGGNAGYSSSGGNVGYSSSSYGSPVGAGPGGNPMNQGGHTISGPNMRMNNFRG